MEGCYVWKPFVIFDTTFIETCKMWFDMHTTRCEVLADQFHKHSSVKLYEKNAKMYENIQIYRNLHYSELAII